MASERAACPHARSDCQVCREHDADFEVPVADGQVEPVREGWPPVNRSAGYCDCCGGAIGSQCLGGSDCDLNMELLRDGVSPGFFRNPLAFGGATPERED